MNTWIKRNQVAVMLGVSAATITRVMNTKGFPKYTRIGGTGHYRWQVKDIEKYIQQRVA